MKNTKVLEMIKSGKIEELVSLLEQEILIEENNLTNKEKSNQKFVANYFRKCKRLKFRPILRTCIYMNDYQYFTDSYVLFKLDKNNYNLLMPKWNDTMPDFPNCENICQESAFANHEKFSTATKNVYNLINLAKSEKKDFIEFVELKSETEQETIAFVNTKVLELAIRGLNYDKDLIDFEIAKREDFSIKPIRIKKGDSLALVMPLVKPQETENGSVSVKLYVVKE